MNRVVVAAVLGLGLLAMAGCRDSVGVLPPAASYGNQPDLGTKSPLGTSQVERRGADSMTKNRARMGSVGGGPVGKQHDRE